MSARDQRKDFTKQDEEKKVVVSTDLKQVGDQYSTPGSDGVTRFT